ncbi:NUDIX hydrolase [Shewanella avicenniae]|uniref:Phosphatase NudJ n=1 Tax=Shewanella avicenniae TaxID=2814294 RepID=A0ABX7QME7_9GAMM|nr:NUDIX hydrolase [Shewanella avicenniae]QSX32197.1 NUDIX hydrolase [Shewanella avicenniae]
MEEKLRYRPNVTVACVIEANQRYLMVEELIDGQQKFNQPAGHLEAHESLLMACEREILEETGLRLSPDALIRIDQFSASTELAFLRFTFCCSLPSTIAAKPVDPDITAAHWFSYEEIVDRSAALRSPLVLDTIDAYRRGQRLPLETLNSRFLTLAP